MTRVLRCFFGFLLFGMSVVVGAEDAPPPSEGSASIGYVGTTGNTESQTFDAQLEYILRRGEWTHNFQAQGFYAEQESEVNGERYFLKAKSDYKIDGDDYLFVQASYTDDRFTGYDYQATASTGYGHYFYDSDDLTLDTYAGIGYRYSTIAEDEIVDEENEAEVMLTLGEDFKWQFSETSKITQLLQSEIGEELTVTRFEVGLVSQLIGRLATKIAFQARHISEVPPDRENTDTQTSVSLVYEF